MYKVIEDLFNFNNGKKINFNRDVYWGLITFVVSIVIINLWR